MRVFSVIFALAVVGTAARAELPQPLIGYWTDTLAYCKNAGDVGEETPVLYDSDGIFGLEFSCEFKAISPTGVGRSWLVKTECLDAGFVERFDEIYVLTHNDRLLIISDFGQYAELLRCPDWAK